MRGWFVVVALAATGCKKKNQPRTSEVTPATPAMAIDAPVVAAEPPAPPAIPAVDPPRPQPPAGPDAIDMPVHDGPTLVGAFIADARAYVEKVDAEAKPYKIEAKYVRSDGTLDPKYGELEISFGIPVHGDVDVDDPDRPTGAPADNTAPKPRPTGAVCPKLVWKAGAWSRPRSYCISHDRVVGPRCSTKTVWERAIAQGAPKDALAILEILGPDARYNTGQRWLFRITDRIRKVDVRQTINDDCDTAVEQ